MREAGLALSLANILFFPLWSELLPGSFGHYYLKTPPSLNMHLGLLMAVLSVACLFFLIGRGFQSAKNPLLRASGKLVFLLLCLLSFTVVRCHVMRYALTDQLPLIYRIDLFLIRPLLVVCGILLLTPLRGRVVRVTASLVLALIPFVVITFSQAAWAAVRIKAGVPFQDFIDKPAPPVLPGKPDAPRVIWLLFDSFDQRRTFEDRAAGLELPHLDRLSRESLYATAAYGAEPNTVRSIPALFIGERVAYARPARVNELLIRFGDVTREGFWSEQPNLFSKARAAGFNTALVGYYHPYGRVLGDHLTRSFWITGRWGPISDDPNITVWDSMTQIFSTQAERILSSIPFIWRFGLGSGEKGDSQPESRERLPERVENYRRLLKETQAIVEDPAYQLVFVHWLIPHHPYIYDHTVNDFSLEAQTSYSDNLELVDRTIGEIRKQLEATGQWERTALLISADHAFNPHAGKIPFLLKLPGQREGQVYPERWNTVITSELLLGILSGEFSTPEQVVSRINQNRLP
jgi:hypothetical protein